MYFYVLCPSMKDGVLCKLYVSYVLTIDQDRGCFRNSKVLQQLPKPYSFIGGNGGTPILSFRARQSYRWLLLLLHATIVLPRENMYKEVDRRSDSLA